MKQIAIVGKPFRSFTAYMKVSHPEIELIGLRDKKDSYKYPKNINKVYDLDFSSLVLLKKDLSKIPTKNIIGIESEYENGILAKSWVGAELGLPAISEAAAYAATDKGEMRAIFTAKNPEITPDFKVVNTEKELTSFAKEHSFPLILKPANLAKSLLVTKNENLAELVSNYNQAGKEIGQIYKKYGVHHRKPTMIVEEYLVGRPYSVDLFADRKGKITALPPVYLVMAQELGINDNYNYLRHMPSGLSSKEDEALKNAAVKAAKALGFTSTAGHCELVMTESGPKVIEIGARIGGYRSKMYSLSYGINMYENIYKVAVGESISVTPDFKRYSAVYELFPDRVGEFVGIENREKIEALDSFISIKMPVEIGTRVGLSRDGFKYCANVTLAHEDKAVFEKDCRFVEEKVRVKLKQSGSAFGGDLNLKIAEGTGFEPVNPKKGSSFRNSRN